MEQQAALAITLTATEVLVVELAATVTVLYQAVAAVDTMVVDHRFNIPIDTEAAVVEVTMQVQINKIFQE
jgi:hypothetical protein